MNDSIIWQEGPYRILEVLDLSYDLENLKGDMFNASYNNVTSEELREEELVFEELVESQGVYGYVLERWNPEIGVGFEHVDSCYGFIGKYDSGIEYYDHYIVDELKNEAKKSLYDI